MAEKKLFFGKLFGDFRASKGGWTDRGNFKLETELIAWPCGVKVVGIDAGERTPMIYIYACRGADRTGALQYKRERLIAIIEEGEKEGTVAITFLQQKGMVPHTIFLEEDGLVVEHEMMDRAK